MLDAVFDLVASSVLDALPSAVVVTDPSGRALFANARAAEVLGKAATDLAGTDLKAVFDATDEEPRSTTKVRRPNGEVITLGYTVSTLTQEPGKGLRAISFRDVSDTVRLTAERDRLLQLAAVGEAMPTLLHELRNPLSAILTTVELLLEESEAGPIRTSLYAVLTEARRIALQLDGVGGVGRTLRSRRAMPIDAACRDICTVMASRADKAKVFLVWEIPDLPLLPLDPSTMRAVLINLITNALHACREGDTVRVHVRMTHGEVLEVSVVDTGVGMTAEVYARCTELFYTTKRHGSGIGLALCRRAVEEVGGRMDIQSVPGVGSAVVLTIPVAKRRPPDSEFPAA